MNVSLRDAGNEKNRKADGAKKRKATDATVKAIPEGTIMGHYLQFISGTMDIMDEYDYMKGFHLVMDNALIYAKAIVDPIIIKRGYIPVYLPPYSPELNPIEQFWKVLKDRVRRNKLNDVENFTSRIIEGSEDVPLEHLQNFIKHSVSCFPKCLNKEPL